VSGDPVNPAPVARPAWLQPRALDSLTDRLAAWRGDVRIGAVVVLLVAVIAGGAWFMVSSRPATAGAAPPSGRSTIDRVLASTTTSSSPTTAPAQLVVDVAGQVRHRGVVTLPAGSRVIDAIRAARGARPLADLDRLNLAAPLADGERILVAKIGDPPTPEPAAPGATTGAGTAGATGGAVASPSTPIDLNTATEAQLESLPGIGPSLAGAILAERDRRGGFTDVGQLRSVPGIGDARFAQIRDLVTV
jgi:competence protein ComEA